ncbi:hypothetical protein, partial [Micromonospora sp. NPDC003241]
TWWQQHSRVKKLLEPNVEPDEFRLFLQSIPLDQPFGDSFKVLTPIFDKGQSAVAAYEAINRTIAALENATGKQLVPFGAPRIGAPMGAEYDNWVLVVGDLGRWRQWPVAEAVVESARSSARPVVVVEVGAGLGPQSATLTALAMALLRFGHRDQRPLVLATAPAAELTTLVNRYGLPVVSPDSTDPDTRWQVTGQDGTPQWSAPSFTPALFVAASEASSAPVRPRVSDMLSEWLEQQDWPQVEDFLRDNTAELLRPSVVQELRDLIQHDPGNRLFPTFEAVLELVQEAGGDIDPVDSVEPRYQPTEPIRFFEMEPLDTVPDRLSVTFALDYLQPKSAPLSRKPWDDRLLRLMYRDERARALATTLAAGVLGEHQGRVDDGRWNATVFSAVAVTLGMTAEEAQQPAFVDAWRAALHDVACCEANPAHRTYWVYRLDELRHMIGKDGVPGHINGPAPHHAELLRVLTETLANC